MAIHSGPNYTFPYFEILVTPKGSLAKDNYWCELLDETNRLNKTTVSNVWVNRPILNFTYTRIDSTSDYVARCEISHYDKAGKNFTVEFHNQNYRLASFIVKGS